MQTSLILLRLVGGLLGLVCLGFGFQKFRHHSIGRRDFLLICLFGICILLVSIEPASVNTLTDMLALKDKQFGRLITLLIGSNLVLWFLVISFMARDQKRSQQFDRLIRNLSKQKFNEQKSTVGVKEITVIIPVLNEARNLEVLLPKIPQKVLGHEISVLIIDDGSTDDTAIVVARYGYDRIATPINRGGGAALRLGYDVAVEGGAKIIVTMDGDGQHQPEEIEQLVSLILQDRFDFVIGSRVLGRREKDSLVRWVGIHFFNFMVNTLAGLKITDCSSGFRAFRVEILEQVLLQQDQFHTAELIIDAARNRVRIGEAPITVLRRHSGRSKKGRNWSYGFNFARTIFLTWFR